MRLDRTISLYAFRPLVEMKVVSTRNALPVLMYHSISDDSEPGISPYYRTSTRPAVFAQHMGWLRDEGFRSVSLEEGVRLAQRGLGQDKVVVITFDDGFRDFHDSAFPILRSHGYSAVVFLLTDSISEVRRSFKARECLTWQEVRALRAQGIQFGSHTVSHPVLYKSSWEEVEDELWISKKKIEQELGERIMSFAYPYAYPQHDPHFTTRLKKLLEGQGYQFCVTTMIGRVQSGDDVLSLKRLPINGQDDKQLFLAKLHGAYDGMGYLQGWSKAIRHHLRQAVQNGFATRPVTAST